MTMLAKPPSHVSHPSSHWLLAKKLWMPVAVCPCAPVCKKVCVNMYPEGGLCAHASVYVCVCVQCCAACILKVRKQACRS